MTRRLAACGVDIQLMGFLRRGARAARTFIGAYQSSLATGGRGTISGGGGIETAGKLVLTSKKLSQSILKIVQGGDVSGSKHSA